VRPAHHLRELLACCGREATTDGALARTPRSHRGRRRLQRPLVASSRHAEHHLLDGPGREGVGVGKALPCLQRQLLPIGAAHSRTTDTNAPATHRQLPIGMPSTMSASVTVMHVPQPAQPRPILLQHRAEHRHPGGHHGLMQRRPHVAHRRENQLLGRRLLAPASSPGSVLHRRFLSLRNPDIPSGRVGTATQISTGTGTTPFIVDGKSRLLNIFM
jgi:hypothetical protein